MEIRYIRNTIDGNSSNSENHWVQIAAWDYSRTNESLIDSNSNRAFSKQANGSTLENPSYPYSRITNGNIDTSDYSSSNSNGSQYIVIDMGDVYNIEFIQVWHYYADMRIYYQNCLEVSSDGTNWTTIQNPTGNMIENADGNSYILFYDDFDKQKIFLKERDTISDGLYNVESSRGLSHIAVNEAENVQSNYATAFYDSLGRFNITWNDLIQQGNVATDQNIEEIYGNIIKTQNNATCNQGCSYSCADNCETVCHDSCGLGCGDNCSSGCGGNCTNSCGNVCSGGCGGTCSSTCAGNCIGGCVTGCQGTCASSCVGANGG
jgi:hypothetical protein